MSRHDRFKPKHHDKMTNELPARPWHYARIRRTYYGTLNRFVSAIYTLSRPIVAPFQGIFPQVSLSIARFEVSTLIAMLIWGLVGMLIAMLIRSTSRSRDVV